MVQTGGGGGGGFETQKNMLEFSMPIHWSDGTGPVLRILSYRLRQHYANLLESFLSERFNWLSARTASFKCYTNAVDMNYIIPVSFLYLSLAIDTVPQQFIQEVLNKTHLFLHWNISFVLLCNLH